MKAARNILAVTVAIVWPLTCEAQLWIDFNSNQSSGGAPVEGDPSDPANAAHQEEGYLCYHASHEVIDGFVTATYDIEFSGTGPATVTMTPDWPNTDAAGVRQSIGRSDGQADTWLGNQQNLLRDWIGTDTRPGNGGGGGWDGTTGDPTYFTLTFGGLPKADYEMIAFFHDVEHMCAFFTIEVSSDGGATYGEPIEGRMTNSLSGGTPAENEVLPDTEPNVDGGDPLDLSSTVTFAFASEGEDVVIRITPLSPGTNTTHKEFVGLNGFQLSQTSAPAPFALTIAPNGSGYDLAWESRAGKLYNVWSNPVLEGDLSTWTLVEGDIAADPPTNTKAVSPEATVLFYRVEEFPVPPVTVLSENFDAVVAPALPVGWTTGANAGDAGSTVWELNAPSTVGPTGAFSPANCVGTNIDADYGTSSDVWLRTLPIDLTTATSATLSFQHWVDIDDFDLGDTGTVRVLAATGLPDTVTELAVIKTDIQGLAPANWAEFSAKLPAAALGNSIVLEFRFVSDSVPDGDSSGWYIDDVLVTKSGS